MANIPIAERLDIIAKGALALIVIFVLISVTILTKTVLLELQVIDRYNQPIGSSRILIRGLGKEPVRLTTDDEGLAILETKMFRKRKTVVITVSRAGHPSVSENIALEKSVPFQTYQIKLGVSSLPIRLIVTPSEASFRISRESTGEIITTSAGNTVTVLQLMPDECYNVEAWFEDLRYTNDTTFCVAESPFDFIYNIIPDVEIPPPPTEFLNLTINIIPSSGNWELKRYNGEVVDSDNGDKTITHIETGRYILTGWLPDGTVPQEKVVTLISDTSIVLDVQERHENGNIAISVDPGDVEWRMIDLTTNDTYQIGVGSSTVQRIPHGTYQINFTYDGNSKESEIIVFNELNYFKEAEITFSGLDDKIQRCLINNDYECAVNEYSICNMENCDIPCNSFAMIGDAYLQLDLPDSALKVFYEGYRNSECNLVNNRSFLFKYAKKLSFYGTNYELTDSVSANLLEIAQVEANPQLEHQVLMIHYPNVYRLLRKLISEPSSEWDVGYMCSLVQRCEELENRINSLDNILGDTPESISSLVSAIIGFKNTLGCTSSF